MWTNFTQQLIEDAKSFLYQANSAHVSTVNVKGSMAPFPIKAIKTTNICLLSEMSSYVCLLIYIYFSY